MGWLLVDEHFDLRPWKRVHHRIISHALPKPLDLELRARRRPPPIGCMEWPAGRVLLQLLLDEELVRCDCAACVLEIGAGVGTTAIGLALAATTVGDSAPLLKVVATDSCESALANLRDNATANGVAAPSLLRAEQWDASDGTSALTSCPVEPSSLTHVIGADIVYHGGAAEGGEDLESGRGLAATLAMLLREQPGISVTLLLVDRFSGGAVAALALNAGVRHTSTTVDPALAAFEKHCQEQSLSVSREPVPSSVVRSVSAFQPIWTRASWWLAGTWEGLQVYRVRRA
mgnify:CR=1 FL=1